MAARRSARRAEALKEIRVYGYNTLLRKHTLYPRWLFLPCHSDHAIMMKDQILESDLRTDKPLMLVNARYTYDLWTQRSAIPAVISGSLFVHYRRRHAIEIASDARGTVAFPAHTIPAVDARFALEEYCERLRELPAPFHPVTICLHWQDLKIGRDRPFRDAGFEVTTAGSDRDRNFARNFYGILRRHRHATSNAVGSYLFYAVEMGIPFFLMGEDPTYVSCGADVNVPPGEYPASSLPEFESVHKAFDTGPITVITDAQRTIVEEAIGIHDCLPAEDLRRVLLDAFLRHYLRRPWALLRWGLRELTKQPRLMLEDVGLRRRRRVPK